MRLLNTHTLRLESFANEHLTPPYAILSHTWGTGEVLFNDVHEQEEEDAKWKRKGPASKILKSAEQASREGLRYIWIDTVCIDKSSSAELSEAINSMFEWYQRATVCYAYIADIQEVQDLSRCRWLRRGWTLQELIAPGHVVFYNQQWNQIGTRASLADDLASLTKIDRGLLRREHFADVEQLLAYTGTATKMSWAADRHTTKKEDRAYCLMGIFKVNMPLLYGEGNRAFQRLQEEILKDTTDTSILVYSPSRFQRSLLAPSPVHFTHSLTALWEASSPLRFSNRQITFETLVCPLRGSSTQGGDCAAILDCYFDRDAFSRAVLILSPWGSAKGVFSKALGGKLFRLQEPNWLLDIKTGECKEHLDLRKSQRKTVTIKPDQPQAFIPPLKITIADRQGLPVQYRIVNSSPPIFNDVMVPLPNPAADLQLGSRVAQGIIALSSDPAGERPCPLSKASLCITWGLRDNNTEPWCKLWTPSSICDAADMRMRKSVDSGMDDLLLDFTRYADCLVPHLHPSATAVVALGRNIQSAVDTLAFGEEGGFFAHSVTAQIVKATFLDRPKLELSIEVRPTERKPSRTASWFKNQSSITTRGS